MEKEFNMNDNISFKDCHGEKHGLRGHVSIYREDPVTKELSLWDESDNIIPISGYQWILMKMFNLYLDSKHNTPYETTDQYTQNTTLAIPDLNESSQLNIGVDPASYTRMSTNIAENHFIQGFMVGNGGGAEDAITSKNTDYSYMKLRNPIPFQQTDMVLDESVNTNQYLGAFRVPGSSAKSYYIKRFDKTPKIVHSWYRSGEAWDYIDPVTQSDLGPSANQNAAKTNRIETYASCSLTITDTDCQSFFTNNGNDQSPVINELGLVAFDTTGGLRQRLFELYETKIKRLLDMVFAHMNSDEYTDDEMSDIMGLANELVVEFGEAIGDHTQSNLRNLYASLQALSNLQSKELLADIKDGLSAVTNIEVKAYYNQTGEYQYEEDKYLQYIDEIDYTDEEREEAQRIKLITYYTFKSIPIQSNVTWRIDYRIYSN